MKVEQAKQIVSAAIEQLSQALERGHSETLRKYLAAIGRFHRYSLRNVMLIASQTHSYARRWFPHVAQTGALCEERRERYFDSRSNRSTEEARRRTNRNR